MTIADIPQWALWLTLIIPVLVLVVAIIGHIIEMKSRRGRCPSCGSREINLQCGRCWDDFDLEPDRV